MSAYPKQILSVQQQLQTYANAGMTIPSQAEALDALRNIGYYRLRGYSYHLYNNTSKQYAPGTSFSQILQLYHFDTELSHVIFRMLSSIEVSLRARLNQALLSYGDALILTNPAVFDDKKLYWQNFSVISSEVARSNDVFIRHHYDHHDGLIPLWASVEILSFGTLSKLIKNLKTGSGSAFEQLAESYKYQSKNGNIVKPSKKMLSSWIQACSILRNMCAHNSRIYNRAINSVPELIAADRIIPQPRYNGLYQILLAMKYLRPNDTIWNSFFADLKTLIQQNNTVVDISRLNFPPDWESHFTL